MTPGRVKLVIEMAALPDVVRGYEEIKLANVAAFRAQAAALLTRLEGTSAS